MSESAQILEQLNAARNICLASPAHYSQVVPGVLGVIGPQAHLDLRRWGSDFLAETFASPVLSADDKQKLSLSILDTLKGFLNRKEDAGEEEDPAVVKSAVQCAASIYPLVFRLPSSRSRFHCHLNLLSPSWQSESGGSSTHPGPG